MKTIILVLLMTITVDAADFNCKKQFSGLFKTYSQTMKVVLRGDNPGVVGEARVTIIEPSDLTKPNGRGYSVEISPVGNKISGFPKVKISDLEFVPLRGKGNGFNRLAARGLMFVVENDLRDGKTAIVPSLNRENRDALSAMGVKDFVIIIDNMGGGAMVAVINSKDAEYYGYLPKSN